MFNPQPKRVKKPKAKAKAIRPRSKKRAKEYVEYNKIKNDWLHDNHKCELCGFMAYEVHHKAGKIGKLLCDTRYFLAVCRECHTHIELNPEWAKKNGYSDKRLNK